MNPHILQAVLLAPPHKPERRALFWIVHLAIVVGLGGALGLPAFAEQKGLLETIHHHKFLTSSIPPNGDVNPYAVVVAEASVGSIVEGDVLIDNFNNISNLQGTGTTIMRYRPSTREMTLFAQVPQKLKECPGGVGLSTAMTMLKTGWIIVGSMPSTDGTTRTKGDGCLLVARKLSCHAEANVGHSYGSF